MAGRFPNRFRDFALTDDDLVRLGAYSAFDFTMNGPVGYTTNHYIGDTGDLQGVGTGFDGTNTNLISP